VLVEVFPPAARNDFPSVPIRAEFLKFLRDMNGWISCSCASFFFHLITLCKNNVIVRVTHSRIFRPMEPGRKEKPI
jgi:hypothetical protein